MISFFNGEFLPHENCRVHVEDRGYQFADGVYEVILCVDNKLIDVVWHIERLMQSLEKLSIDHCFNVNQLINIQKQLFEKNNKSEGTCYIQITRGIHPRFPGCPKNLEPTIFASIAPRKEFTKKEFDNGVSVMTHEDIRWKRCDVKSINLIASTIINQKAKDCGFDDVIFVRDDVVTEASYANVFIVDLNGNLITRGLDNLILGGITRKRIIKIAREVGINVIEKNFDVFELKNSAEVFLTSSSLIIRPVFKIDDKIIGGDKHEKSFKTARKLSELYKKFIN